RRTAEYSRRTPARPRQLASRLDAVDPGHAYVHEHDIGMQLLAGPYCPCSVRCRGDDGEVRLRVEELGEHITHDLMVVGDDDAYGSGFGHGDVSTLAGRMASTRYPTPGAAPVRAVPPTPAARSCMPSTP